MMVVNRTETAAKHRSLTTHDTVETASDPRELKL